MAQDEAQASSSDPSLSLSRNVSFSRLNARAPEFVPSPRADPHAIPPPPPPPPPSQPRPFQVPVGPIHPHVRHVIPIQNHPHHHHPHPHHHVQLQYHPHQHHFYAPASAEQHQQQSQGQSQGADHVDHSVHSSNSNSKPKLSDDAALKILNQVLFYFLFYIYIYNRYYMTLLLLDGFMIKL